MAEADPGPLRGLAAVTEVTAVDAADLDAKLRAADAPFVVRGLAAAWPLVQAARQSGKAARDYIAAHARPIPFTVSVGKAESGGRLFYDAAMQMNFGTVQAKLPDIFARIDAVEHAPDAPPIYLGSVDLHQFFTGLHEANQVDLGTRDALASIWIGTRTRIAAHNDFPRNLAICAAGRRRFTVFPREQFRNLYLGPVDNTPAGRAVSMVDFHNPDLARHPRFAEALVHAQVAELEPGDALYLPSLWWHHVEGLAPFNVLVNYWWRETPRWLGQPQDALNLAMLAIRELRRRAALLARAVRPLRFRGWSLRDRSHSGARPRRARRADAGDRRPAARAPAAAAQPMTPRRIVVAGGGTAGWMAAAALARSLGRAATITLVESDEIGTVGVGESTIPPLVTYNRLLGINEAEFMRATGATFKLGILFEGWRNGSDRYFHSFGTTGKDHWAAGFQHYWLYGREQGHDASYDDYCLELQAAFAGKFAHLPDDQINYAYQLDAARYAAFLRTMAEGDGVTRVEGRIARVELDSTSGDVAALVLDRGDRIEGDLFLDCTGFRALLIEGALHAGFDDWTHWLPCDAAVAVQTENVGPPVPYTRAMTHDAGWQWRIPLQHRSGNGLVYCSRYLDRAAAEARLLGNVEGAVVSAPNHLRFAAGARRKQWHRNCIAIGLAGGFMEPLESTAIHLIQRAVIRLIRMFPLAGISARDVEEFNEQQMTDMLQIRDFLVLHYVVTERRDSPFWRHCAAIAIPDTLSQKIELFRETGRVFRRNEELFQENSWVQVMMGQGITPHSHHPIVEKLTDAELTRLLTMLRDNVRRTVAGLPSHEQYVNQYCGQRRAEAA